MSTVIRGLGALMVALLIGLWATPTTARASATEAAPTVCRVGVYFMSIHNVDTAAGTFDANFWMWSVCPTRDMEPLKTMQFLNAESVEGSLDSNLQRGEGWWSTRLFTGTFRENFDLANYPFDHQSLDLQIEESVLDERGLRYSLDVAQSGLDAKLTTPGWLISDLKLQSGVTTRDTTFGDPSLPNGQSGYASMTVKLKANRTKGANFIKATFPLYIAAFLALISMGFDVVATDHFLGRMGALGTILFAVVLSFVSVDQLVGPHQGLFFLDQIHFAVLALILLATGWSVLAHRAAGRFMDGAVVQRWDLRVTLGLLALYLIANLLMILNAASG